MRILGSFYVLSAVVFFFFPMQLVFLMNLFPQVFSLTQSLPEPIEKFWLVFATSEMVVLATLSFFAAESRQAQGYIWVHLLAQVTSGTAFIYLFMYENPYFAYLLGAILCVVILILILWSRIKIRG